MAALAAVALLSLLVGLLLRPDRRSAWQQAALTHDLPQERDPVRQAAWSEGLRQLLSQSDALGPRPEDPARLRRWLQVQCRITKELQALQRQHGRPLESADRMGRPAACEQLGGAQGP